MSKCSNLLYFSMLAPVSVLLVALAAAVVARTVEPEIRFTSTTTPSPLNPGHVPESACVNMAPVHGNCNASNEISPYRVTVSKTSVANGGSLTVTMAGIDGAVFKGIYAQCRNSEDVPVGRFEAADSRVDISDCPPGQKNAASYVTRTDALPSLELTWFAPSDVTGDVVCRVTFVKTFCDFWLGVVSPSVKIVAGKSG